VGFIDAAYLDPDWCVYAFHAGTAIPQVGKVWAEVGLSPGQVPVNVLIGFYVEKFRWRCVSESE